MKTIIAGSRALNEIQLVNWAVEQSGFNVTEVVSGGARGVDMLGQAWAIARQIPCKIMNADWDTHGRSAGYKRNCEMADYADALVAVWDGKSRGTKHMIDIAKRANLQVYVFKHIPDNPTNENYWADRIGF